MRKIAIWQSQALHEGSRRCWCCGAFFLQLLTDATGIVCWNVVLHLNEMHLIWMHIEML
jgi:hypothetical protein